MMYHPKCEYCLPSTNSTLEVKSSNTYKLSNHEKSYPGNTYYDMWITIVLQCKDCLAYGLESRKI